jgi:hypothetical protein
MAARTYEEDLRQARIDLTTAVDGVMALVRGGKASGEQWDAANKRENLARVKVDRLLNSLANRSGNF